MQNHFSHLFSCAETLMNQRWRVMGHVLFLKQKREALCDWLWWTTHLFVAESVDAVLIAWCEEQVNLFIHHLCKWWGIAVNKRCFSMFLVPPEAPFLHTITKLWITYHILSVSNEKTLVIATTWQGPRGVILKLLLATVVTTAEWLISKNAEMFSFLSCINDFTNFFLSFV